MFSRFLAAIAILLAVTLAMPVTVQAQGPSVAQAPQNARQWNAMLRQEIRRSLRRSDTALNTTGGNARRSGAVALIITRDGRVSDVVILRSKGKAMDAAYVRSFSNMRLPPFSPDMQGDAITVSFEIGVKPG
ncbi:hypothetical protein GIY56_11240 [Paracoccus sp. YIM 132242]|uniref:TonB C-terminal domain-containing protein n=1 Tax=Paracoccus lichenicola TaxID=2665644 RepID=A0A6L6HNX6_9RHOB|nr:energy transducer TonB [Paracoccus lichenicola]MTE00867.1 hypothetical protein [Paracoccus lichenicola]